MVEPLSGIRIVDFTWVGAGPFTTKIFADFGAEVIKVESTSRPDQLRKAQPRVNKDSLNASGYFSNRNTNKKSITLNMKNPKSREIILELVKNSDIVCNSFSPNVMEKFGLSYDEVKKVKNDIIYLSMPMQGNTGPHKDYLGFGATISALIGLNYLTAFPGKPPAGSGTNYPDHVPNPCHAAFALLAALEYREKTGKGQNIELSQTESSVCVFPNAVMDYAVNGNHTEPVGNQHEGKSPHGIYPCKGSDSWCAISISNDIEWTHFCKVTNQEELLKDERFLTHSIRYQNQELLDSIVGNWTKNFDAEQVMKLLQEHGIAAGVVRNAEDLVMNDSNLKHRKFWQWLDHPEMGRTVYHGIPFKFSAISTEYKTPAPLIGQHTDEVIGKIDKYKDRIELLKQEGVLK